MPNSCADGEVDVVAVQADAVAGQRVVYFECKTTSSEPFRVWTTQALTTYQAKLRNILARFEPRQSPPCEIYQGADYVWPEPAKNSEACESLQRLVEAVFARSSEPFHSWDLAATELMEWVRANARLRESLRFFITKTLTSITRELLRRCRAGINAAPRPIGVVGDHIAFFLNHGCHPPAPARRFRAGVGLNQGCVPV